MNSKLNANARFSLRANNAIGTGVLSAVGQGAWAVPLGKLVDSLALKRFPLENNSNKVYNYAPKSTFDRFDRSYTPEFTTETKYTPIETGAEEFFNKSKPAIDAATVMVSGVAKSKSSSNSNSNSNRPVDTSGTNESKVSNINNLLGKVGNIYDTWKSKNTSYNNGMSLQDEQMNKEQQNFYDNNTKNGYLSDNPVMSYNAKQYGGDGMESSYNNVDYNSESQFRKQMNNINNQPLY